MIVFNILEFSISVIYGGVVVPEGTETVRLRARDSLDGWAETAFDLALPAD